MKINSAVVLVYGCCLLVSSIHGLDPGYFWHLTDMHWDPTYNGTHAGLSCNPDMDPDYGPYGSFLCDSPWQLVESSLRAMFEIRPDPDFIIWTGDDTPHIWNDTILNREVVRQIIFDLTTVIEKYFNDTVVFSALGNHDWSPKSQLPPRADPLYSDIADRWMGWLTTPEAKTTFRKGAYYWLRVHDGLIMVVLNTNLYYKSNELTDDMPDPANQLQWMDELLTEAARNGSKAIVIGHVPPGMFEKHMSYYWFYEFYNDVFTDLLRKHIDTISALHFSHHHTDTFRLVYSTRDTPGNPLGTLFLAPAVAPWETTLPEVMGGRGNNPAIRLVEYERTDGQVLDVHQYYLDLREANREGRDEWKLEYSFRDYYGVPDMTPGSMHELAERLGAGGETFRKYYRANGVLYDPGEVYGPETEAVHYCSMVHLAYTDYEECVEGRLSSSSTLFNASHLTLTYTANFLVLYIAWSV